MRASHREEDGRRRKSRKVWISAHSWLITPPRNRVMMEWRTCCHVTVIGGLEGVYRPRHRQAASRDGSGSLGGSGNGCVLTRCPLRRRNFRSRSTLAIRIRSLFLLPTRAVSTRMLQFVARETPRLVGVSLSQDSLPLANRAFSVPIYSRESNTQPSLAANFFLAMALLTLLQLPLRLVFVRRLPREPSQDGSRVDASPQCRRFSSETPNTA